MTEATAEQIIELIGELWPKLGWHEKMMATFGQKIQRLHVDYEQAEASLNDFAMTATGYKARSPEPAMLFERIARCAPTTQRFRIADYQEPRNNDGGYRAVMEPPGTTTVAARFWRGKVEDSPVEVMTWEQYQNRTGVKKFGHAGDVAKKFVSRLATEREV